MLFTHQPPNPKTHPLLLICLLGPNGSGKGTQADHFMDSLHYAGYNPAQVNVSSLLQGPEAAAKKARGEPISSSFVGPIVRDAIGATLGRHHTAIVTDGYPRYDVEQADDFARIVDYYRFETVIAHIVSERELCVESIVTRAEKAVLRGEAPRADDLDPAAVDLRLKLHFDSEARILECLTGFHGFRKVSAERQAWKTSRDLHRELLAQIWSPSHVDRLMPETSFAAEPAGCIGKEIFDPGFTRLVTA